MRVTIKIPDWANYMAQDINGDWFAYKNKPYFNQGFWAQVEGTCLMEYLYQSEPSKDASKELWELY